MKFKNVINEEKVNNQLFKIRLERDEKPDMHYEGTLSELINKFKYTLDTGAAHSSGGKKININPKNINELIKNLNNAVNNTAANGYSGKLYILE